MNNVGEFVISSVLPSQQKFEETDGPALQPSDGPALQPSDGPVLQAPCYNSVLSRKQRRIHPWGVRAGRPKRPREKRGAQPNFGSSFYIFFSPHPGPALVNWASQECCLFYPRFSLQSSDLPLFYFHSPFPSLSFNHCHSGLLFPILTT